MPDHTVDCIADHSMLALSLATSMLTHYIITGCVKSVVMADLGDCIAVLPISSATSHNSHVNDDTTAMSPILVQSACLLTQQYAVKLSLP